MEATPGNTHANTPNDNKMTILYNAQNSHSDVDLDEISSSKDCLVEVAGVEPASESTLTGLSPGAVGYFGSLTLPVPITAGKPTRRQVR